MTLLRGTILVYAIIVVAMTILQQWSMLLGFAIGSIGIWGVVFGGMWVIRKIVNRMVKDAD